VRIFVERVERLGMAQRGRPDVRQERECHGVSEWQRREGGESRPSGGALGMLAGGEVGLDDVAGTLLDEIGILRDAYGSDDATAQIRINLILNKKRPRPEPGF
jgi:hypothetical protein